MRIATYNVEWFSALFDDKSRPAPDLAMDRTGRGAAAQWAGLETVFRALDADGIMVVEAPDQSHSRDTVLALEAFARKAQIRANRAVIGFANETQQEIAFLYDPNVLEVRHVPVGDLENPAEAPRFDAELRIDLDVDARADLVRFSKPPLELEIRPKGFAPFHAIGVHLKSKAPHGARDAADATRISIKNRRKQLAQAIWLRRRIEAHLAAGTPLMVMGDLNDGPGLDEYEDLFGRSSVEIVMGEGAAALMDPHARLALCRRFGMIPSTSRFYLGEEGKYLSALLDYIFVSKPFSGGTWRIWHPFEDPKCYHDPELRAALLAASDHFPVTLDVAPLARPSGF